MDHLTVPAHTLLAAAIIDGDECQLRQRLQETERFDLPAPRFGASDCRTCNSHLLQWRT